MERIVKAIVVCGGEVTKEAAVCFFKKYGYEIVGVTSSGEECCDMVLKYRPHVVMYDARLDDMDGFGLKHMILSKDYRYMAVYAFISSTGEGELIESAMTQGTDIFSLVPLNEKYLDDRIRKILDRKLGGPDLDRFGVLNYVSRMMHDVGVPASIRGYDYIRDSIMLALTDRDILRSITKELYPTIAKNYSTTPSRVERAIRHAVEVAWQRGDVEVLNGIFGYTVKSSKGKPTNGEFISMLTERVRLDLHVG